MNVSMPVPPSMRIVFVPWLTAITHHIAQIRPRMMLIMNTIGIERTEINNMRYILSKEVFNWRVIKALSTFIIRSSIWKGLIT